MTKIDLDEDEYLAREAFAQYGLTMYLAQSLEKSVGIWITFGLTKDRKITQFQFDHELEETFKNTFGGLIKIIKDLEIQIEPNLLAKLEVALMERNRLAHHYWWEHSVSFTKREGKLYILNELKGIQILFTELDGAITSLTDKDAESKGVTSGIIQKFSEDLVEGPIILFEQGRILRKKEMLIEVGRLYTNTDRRQYAPIFTFEDGSRWTLGDKGFTYPSEINDTNYEIEKSIVPLLPTLIETRSKNSTPWEYDLNMDCGYVLSVKKTQGIPGILFSYSIKKK
ncbi:hypothetical protein EHO58_01595 [Leptospira selangorensis]|uniref:hypothetical protein n=1 Tax=Leptospira selangorensis TaxID=2484982 RepID=UPI00108281F5|nr:hypothetical protein [Leptospira selangorensis]TGK10144.1 hypothetical protein EHO58_01595 [Leptospira selangorensis]